MIINMLKDINSTTQDISARLNVVENEVSVLKDVSDTTHDISARLNLVETKVSAGGVCSICSGGLAATLEQMRAMLRQQGSGLCPSIILVHMHFAYAC